MVGGELEMVIGYGIREEPMYRVYQLDVKRICSFLAHTQEDSFLE
jgi:hypothetical protein